MWTHYCVLQHNWLCFFDAIILAFIILYQAQELWEFITLETY